MMSQRLPLQDAYRDDLAYVHDAGFTGLARTAAPVLLALLRQAGIDRGLVVDLACGSGAWAQELSTAGYEVLGIDLSAAMVRMARRRVQRAQFRVESFLRAELPACVAVTAVGEGFNYVFDRGNTPQALVGLFRRIHRALVPGGLLVFDVAGPGRVPGGASQQRYTEGKDWVVLVSAEEDRARRMLTRRITTFRKVGELYRRDDEVHRQRLYERSGLVRQLRRVGFRVRTLRGYTGAQFAPGHFVVVARKPALSRASGG
jgi:SAM-dependent methyltransferase